MHCSVMGREALAMAIENHRTGRKARKLSGKVVCHCFGVTEEELEQVISGNHLTTVEQVTNYCKARRRLLASAAATLPPSSPG